MNSNKSIWRIPILALAGAGLLAGMWAGLVRIGWGWPPLNPTLPMRHGPLMVSGFLGTLIIVERAVALRKNWAYMGAAASGLGGMVLLAGMKGWFGPLLLAIGSLWLVLIFIYIVRQHPADYTVVMAAGALCWLVGSILWLFGAPMYLVVSWWAAFLVLTIAGERLELSRVTRLSRQKRMLFWIIVSLISASLALQPILLNLGWRGFGLGLLGLAVWLVSFDVARRTVRMSGLQRYIAVCLLSGYIWLGFAGLLAVTIGPQGAGFLYDAMLHAIFVGYVFSMVFGHAPIILPAVIGSQLVYHPRFYIPLMLLHLSLLVRISGDLGYSVNMRLAGGLLNATAILLFLGMVVVSIVYSRRTSS